MKRKRVKMSLEDEVGNTVGRQDKISLNLSKEQAAFVAGFLEGDGCISVKIEPNPTSKRLGYAVKVKISFTQHTRNRKILVYLHRILGGDLDDYFSKSLSELVIRERGKIHEIIKQIKPYLITKKRQAQLAEEIIKILEKHRIVSWITPNELLKIVKLTEEIRKLNSNRKNKTIYTLERVKSELKKRGLISCPRND